MVARAVIISATRGKMPALKQSVARQVGLRTTHIHDARDDCAESIPAANAVTPALRDGEHILGLSVGVQQDRNRAPFFIARGVDVTPRDGQNNVGGLDGVDWLVAIVAPRLYYSAFGESGICPPPLDHTDVWAPAAT